MVYSNPSKYSAKELEAAAITILGDYHGTSFIESFNFNTKYSTDSSKYKEDFVKNSRRRKRILRAFIRKGLGATP